MSNISLKAISDSEVEKIHEETLKVFESVGIKVRHEETLNKLAQAGAQVNQASGLVKLPKELVKELLEQIPHVAVMTGLNGKRLEVGKDNKYYGSLVIDPFIIDYKDGPRRPMLEDVRRNSIVGESLDRISFKARMQYPVSDISEPDSYLKTMEVYLTHNSKHNVALPTSMENLKEWMDVTEVIADAAGLDVNSTPLMSLGMAITSPLQIDGFNVEIIKAAIERCYPVVPTVCPMAGTTCPYSIAGSALIGNIESLAGNLLVQLYKPGHPVLYRSSPSVTDLKSGHDLYFSAECMLFQAIATQMASFYKIPASGIAGGSLTHRPDVQNGAENMLIALSATMLAQNFVFGLGCCHNANGMSSEYIIMQCGLYDMAEYLACGVDTSSYKMSFESIKDVGPGGNFLTDKLTLDLLHGDEFFKSSFVDSSGGYQGNTPGMYEIAHQKADDMVKDYQPTVPAKVREAIKKFFTDKYEDKLVTEM